MSRPTLIAVALSTLAAMAACSEPQLTTGETEDREGQLRVAVAVSGAELDASDFQISVNGGAPFALTATTLLTLDAGTHTVQLYGLPGHCTAPSTSSQITVTGGMLTTLSFAVSCAQLRTGMDITIATGGDDPAERVRVMVCPFVHCSTGVFEGEVAADTVLHLDLAPGRYYFVRIVDAPTNCDLPTTQAGYVATNNVIDLRVMTTCWQPAWIRAEVSVSGGDPDENFRVLVNGRDLGTIASGVPTLVESMATTRAILITDIAANCEATTTNPVTASLTAADTLAVHFAVHCTPMPTLRIGVTAVGTNVPDSLFVGIDTDPSGFDYLHWGFLAPNSTTDLKFPLSDGPHEVWLDGLWPACTVQGANPVPVVTTAGTITEVTFSVTCQ